MLQEPNNIARDVTVGYYDREVDAFAANTAHADVSDLLSSFTSLLPPGAAVLDWGCGTGRDSRAMLDMGFAVTSIDASASMREKAAELFGVEVTRESFDDLNVESAFDGIWACASLLHVRRSELPTVLRKAHKALVPGGVLYASFKYGSFEGLRGGRWFTDLDERSLAELVPDGFDILRMWITADVRPERRDEKWLNCLLRRHS
ncbi:MAG: class I SAM-dependent methyltransferase [Coriobacteriales bacterium]|jgi:SAM-dependent methyltransferase